MQTETIECLVPVDDNGRLLLPEDLRRRLTGYAQVAVTIGLETEYLRSQVGGLGGEEILRLARIQKQPPERIASLLAGEASVPAGSPLGLRLRALVDDSLSETGGTDA